MGGSSEKVRHLRTARMGRFGTVAFTGHATRLPADRQLTEPSAASRLGGLDSALRAALDFPIL